MFAEWGIGFLGGKAKALFIIIVLKKSFCPETTQVRHLTESPLTFVSRERRMTAG